ncbi:transglutaminaseTgpA domain-containing protein [Agromyces silvae]|uniref:transglutaminaseTgpA domain-containing protein n=1 Tax=Agromyces silvae TaxID=3388266 RepID=UPI00280AD7F8|nr:transglutaminaseTgpA domain-containing protein [Agromyces protaetiae]
MHPELAPLTRGQRTALAGATALLMIAAVAALGPLIDGSAWGWMCAFMIVGVIGASLGLRVLRTPGFLVPILGIGVLIGLLTLLFGGGTSFALIVPTGATFEYFGALAAGAEQTIQQQSVPAIPVPALQFALAIGAGVLALLADFSVQSARLPALAAVPAFVPVLIPGFIIADGAEPIVLICTAAAFLLLLRLDVRFRRRGELARLASGGEDSVVTDGPRRVPLASTIGATLGVATVGLLVAGVLTAATPSVSSSLLVGSQNTGALFSRGVSPFIDLGRDLRRPGAVPAFSYVARDGDRPYFTLLTLDLFEGEVWGVTDRSLDAENTVDRMPRPVGLDPDIVTTEHPIDVTIDELRTTWLPVPYPAASVERLNGSWFWDRESLTVRSADANTAGQRYRVNRLVASPTPEQLRAAERPDRDAFASYLALPDERPQIITDTAAAVAGSAASPYDAAVAIQEYLRGPRFQYSVDAPVEEGYDGGGYDVIASFLDLREGYCVHFASTMAVLARESGIPSRISIGYIAGSATDRRVDNVAVVEVDSHDLHAWPELYFEGVGWVPFEPTPGRGTVPSYTRPQAGQVPTTPVTPGRLPVESARPDVDPDRGVTEAGSQTAEPAGQVWVRVGGLALVAGAIVLLPAGLRLAQGLTRRRRMRHGAAPAQAAWDEVRASARDLGAGGAETETARAFTARIASRPAFDGDAGAALAELRNAIERERYGPPGDPRPGTVRLPAEELVTAVATVRSALRADAGAATRVRAVLLPASLLPGVRLPGRNTPAGA